MKILKEEKIEQVECPKCNGALDFPQNERVKDSKWWWANNDKYTNNAWFECITCNTKYLIEDYYKEKEGGKKQ